MSSKYSDGSNSGTCISFQGNDPAFIRAIFETHERSLRIYFLYRLRDKDEADDCLQEVIIKTWRSILNGFVWKSDDHIRAWLFTVAHNLWVSICRRVVAQGPHKSLHHKQNNNDLSIEDKYILDVGFEAEALDRLDASQLLNCLRSLKPVDQEIIHLYFFEDFSVEEIAGILSKTTGYIRNRRFRALNQLRLLCGAAGLGLSIRGDGDAK